MTTKKIIAAGLLSASLMAGGAVGAVLGTPSLISAQEAEEGAADEEATEAPGTRRGRHARLHLAFAASAADALGLTGAELREELADGDSIADVADQRGVDVQAVIDAVVADAVAAIDDKVAAGELDADRAEELKATLTARVTAAVNGEGARRGFGHHHRRHHRGVALTTAAEALGMTAEELRDELADGSSIAEVAEERGVDVQTVIDALVADATERITALVNGEPPGGEETAAAGVGA